MKPAAEWLNAVGEASASAMFSSVSPPGIELERVIRRIQADAMRSAIQMLPPDLHQQLTENIIRHILHEAEKLEAP